MKTHQFESGSIKPKVVRRSTPLTGAGWGVQGFYREDAETRPKPSALLTCATRALEADGLLFECFNST